MRIGARASVADFRAPSHPRERDVAAIGEGTCVNAYIRFDGIAIVVGARRLRWEFAWSSDTLQLAAPRAVAIHALLPSRFPRVAALRAPAKANASACGGDDDGAGDGDDDLPRRVVADPLAPACDRLDEMFGEDPSEIRV